MLDKKNILIVDDEEAICFAFGRFFSRRGATVLSTGSLQEGLRLCAKADLLFLDIRLNDGDGLETLPEIRRRFPSLPVVIMTAYGTLDRVAKAMQYGAFEYLTKPLDLKQAETLAMQAFAQPGGKKESTGDYAGFVGDSPRMQALLLQLLRFAQTDQPVLLCGETGTGKELAAHFLHQRGKRVKGPLVSVNCGALPENLVESELFGHCKGTFTGAVEDKTGLCEAADKGILFLDEIGELPLAAQVKLLRFLDCGRLEKLGRIAPEQLDVRVISASNRDLRQAVKAGSFRSDLYYRLAVLQVHMPSLREHMEDIPDLARYFLPQNLVLSPEALCQLFSWDWPGNVRELRNVLSQAAASAHGNVILPSDIPKELQSGKASLPEPGSGALQRYADSITLSGENCLQDAVAEVQRVLIERALRECDGNQSAAAEKLGIHRNSLRRLLDRKEETKELDF